MNSGYRRNMNKPSRSIEQKYKTKTWTSLSQFEHILCWNRSWYACGQRPCWCTRDRAKYFCFVLTQFEWLEGPLTHSLVLILSHCVNKAACPHALYLHISYTNTSCIPWNCWGMSAFSCWINIIGQVSNSVEQIKQALHNARREECKHYNVTDLSENL